MDTQRIVPTCDKEIHFFSQKDGWESFLVDKYNENWKYYCLNVLRPAFLYVGTQSLNGSDLADQLFDWTQKYFKAIESNSQMWDRSIEQLMYVFDLLGAVNLDNATNMLVNCLRTTRGRESLQQIIQEHPNVDIRHRILQALSSKTGWTPEAIFDAAESLATQEASTAYREFNINLLISLKPLLKPAHLRCLYQLLKNQLRDKSARVRRTAFTELCQLPPEEVIKYLGFDAATELVTVMLLVFSSIPSRNSIKESFFNFVAKFMSSTPDVDFQCALAVKIDSCAEVSQLFEEICESKIEEIFAEDG